MAALGVLLASLLPFKIRRVRPTLWVIVGASRLFNLVFNIRVRSSDMAYLRRHEGMIFLNHLSFIEPLVFLALMPCRFLAAVELRKRPVIGWIAHQIGTIFVVRQDRASRKEAREIIIKVLNRSIYPPTIIFPEGRLGLGDQINPFRYGIFETAIQSQTPYLVCSLSYNHQEIAIWRGSQGERMLSAVWRLATFPGPLWIELRPLNVVQPSPHDQAQHLAHSAQRQIAADLQLPTQIPQDSTSPTAQQNAQ
jgi:1-acyl-sn-glycerol-3-phosphate acyltransferase